MAYTIGDKTYRNLQEQVLQNARDIDDIKTVNTLLNQFGIKVVGECDTALDLPDPSTYSGNYGDAYAVGTETPYDLYIFTRPFDGEEYPHWFNIGPFPLEGPEGPQGETGAQGEKGNTGGAFLTGEGNPPTSIGTQDGQGYLDALTGNIYQYSTNPASWTRVGSIRGPQGVQGIQGPQGPAGPQGATGPQGPQGPAGKVVNIVGNLASIENLPTPSTVDFHDAYLVGASVPYHLYIIEGTESDSSTWSWFDAGPFTSGGEYTRVTDDNDSYVANLEATTTPESGAVARYDSDGQLQCETPTVDKDVANKKYVDDNTGSKVLVLTGSAYRAGDKITDVFYSNGELDFSKLPNYIYFPSGSIKTALGYTNYLENINGTTSRDIGGLFSLYRLRDTGTTKIAMYKYDSYGSSGNVRINSQNISTWYTRHYDVSIDGATGNLTESQYSDLLSKINCANLFSANIYETSFSGITLDATTKTASLPINSSRWTELTDTTRKHHRVSLIIPGIIGITYLDRVFLATAATPKTCDYACIVDRTIYWAHFENNNGVYSGILKIIDPVEGNVADTPSALLTTLKTQDGTVYGINNAKKYNVIKIDIPQSPNYTNLALYYLISDHSMNVIYTALKSLSGITVDSTNINTVLASVLSTATSVSTLENLFDSLQATTEKNYYGFTDTNFNVFEINRLIANQWNVSGTDLKCYIYFNNIGDESIAPTSSGETLTDWQTITVTLEDYKADNPDEIYDQETA